MTLVKVKRIFDNETFTPNAGFSFVNCENLGGTPKEAWLLQDPNSDVFQSIVTEDPNDQFAIKGVFIGEDFASNGVLIDGAIDDFLTKCNACCGDPANVIPIYNNVFPTRPEDVLKDYSIVRVDRGNGQDRDVFILDYMDYIVDGTLQSSHNEGTGETTYTFKSYTDPIAIGGDVLTETNRVFDSNVSGVLVAPNNNYRLVVTIDGVAQAAVVATTIPLLAAAATTAFGTKYGTFSSALTDTIVRLTTTVVDAADLVITQVII